MMEEWGERCRTGLARAWFCMRSICNICVHLDVTWAWLVNFFNSCNWDLRKVKNIYRTSFGKNKAFYRNFGWYDPVFSQWLLSSTRAASNSHHFYVIFVLLCLVSLCTVRGPDMLRRGTDADRKRCKWCGLVVEHKGNNPLWACVKKVDYRCEVLKERYVIGD